MLSTVYWGNVSRMRCAPANVRLVASLFPQHTVALKCCFIESHLVPICSYKMALWLKRVTLLRRVCRCCVVNSVRRHGQLSAHCKKATTEKHNRKILRNIILYNKQIIIHVFLSRVFPYLQTQCLKANRILIKLMILDERWVYIL